MIDLRIDDLTAGRSSFVAGPISMQLGRGEGALIYGGNGIGKTTLLFTLAGHLPAIGGTVILNGVDITKFPPYRRDLTLVPAESSTFPNMSVRENLGFALNHARKRPDEQRLIRAFDLDALLDKRGGAVSLGQSKLIDVARALMYNPALMLLDEPFSHLSEELAAKVQDALNRYRIDRGGMLIVTSQARISGFDREIPLEHINHAT
jgi:ABC-type branched-subunit amino acid transport system ATPase component